LSLYFFYLPTYGGYALYKTFFSSWNVVKYYSSFCDDKNTRQASN
jgi:hypothetical protein